MLYQNGFETCFKIYVSVIVIANAHTFKSSYTDDIKVYKTNLTCYSSAKNAFVGETQRIAFCLMLSSCVCVCVCVCCVCCAAFVDARKYV